MGMLALAILAASAPLFAGQAAHPWRAADGTALPFRTEEELVQFLRTARVLSETRIGAGVNDARKLLLEKDGVRAHAIFREVEVERENVRIDERQYQRFRDSYKYECAAYELAKLLGLENVPPAVVRHVGLREGSVQIWLESTVDETASDFRPRHAMQWTNQLWSMYLFDNLIFNVDRNSGNLLVDDQHRIWLIDHTRAFQIVPELLDEGIVRVDRRLWKKLLTLERAELERALTPYLDELELRSLLARRDALIQHVEKLLSERGESVVFY